VTTISVRAPSRLHFGLLAWGADAPRQFGGVGLMVAQPGLELSARPAPAGAWSAEGPLADRALRFAGRVAGLLAASGAGAGTGATPPPLHFRIHSAPPEHAGLGTGTQLGLAVARILAAAVGRADARAPELAELAGRGLRSGIGLHGSDLGGLVVDGGRRGAKGTPPLLAHLEFPAEWDVLVVIPGLGPGLHGPDEVRAFAGLPPIAASLTDRLCRLVLLGILPAVAERDLPRFGEALTDLQRLVGQTFAPAQGGPYARPELQAIVDFLRAEGLHGVGQSSWGPTLYGFGQLDPDRRASISGRLRSRFALGEGTIVWTKAASGSAMVRRDEGP